MKKNSKVIFLTTLIVIILLYTVSAIFTLGTIFAPQTALSIKSTNYNREQTYQNAFVTIDLNRSREDSENVGNSVVMSVSQIYVYVGEVRTHAVDEQGNPYVEIYFHYKTTANNDSSYFGEPIVAKIPVKSMTGGYEWIKVFDAKTDAETIDYSRFKISTPDSIDIHEVVFTDSTGYVMEANATFGTQEQQNDAKLLFDEQNMFKYSQSKKYHFTDGELKILASVNALKGGKAEIGEGPFSTILYFVSTFIFGNTTFGLRFFDFIAGIGLLILACAFAKSMFGKEKYATLTLLSVLSLGAVFTASNFALCSIGTFFAVLSTYLSSKYFIKHYYFEDEMDGILCLLGAGFFFGLAVASDVSYAITILGHIVLFGMARRRAYTQYKKDEKEAVGLAKEDVFLSYRKKNLISLGVMAIALVVLPCVLFLASYVTCSAVYKNYFEVGFVKGAVKCFAQGFVASYQSFPLALFVGFGGIKNGAFYSFLNYFTCIFALLCFAFVTFVAFFGKKIEFFKEVKTIKNKYKITTTAFLSLCLPVFLGLTSSPYGFAGVSVFMCAYVAFAHSILIKCVKKSTVDLAFSIATIIGIVFFAMAYVGYVGLALPELAKSILYYWQVA
ncbi:MAG: phospholipid carrier-dependent glycosyltransferase [Clostridia bacterium]|nr:phospholipid carrier-dependent glycosyltransferase [Clostridia bacterium]